MFRDTASCVCVCVCVLQCFNAWKEFYEEGERKPGLRLVRRHDLASLLGSIISAGKNAATSENRTSMTGELIMELGHATPQVVACSRRILELHCDGANV